jgi:hypothetical protein
MLSFRAREGVRKVRGRGRAAALRFVSSGTGDLERAEWGSNEAKAEYPVRGGRADRRFEEE